MGASIDGSMPYKARGREAWPRRRGTLGVGALALFLALLAPACGTLSETGGPPPGPVEGAAVKNYGIVRQGVLVRSGLPKANDYAWVRQQGVKSIVNLTEEKAGEVLLKPLGFLGQEKRCTRTTSNG